MTEPTPGPWTIYANTHIMAGNRLVANCGGYTSNVDRDKIRAENAANARLIAKARHLPVLIAALKVAQGYVQAVEHQLSASHSPNVITPDLAKINAALALVQETE